jgi:hypothetical protein
LPLIGEVLDRLTHAKWFTKLDLKDAYHRVRIKQGDEWKTAFRTKYGLFEYMVLPFGLTNAPATFQSYINRCLAGVIDVTCILYLDDILIYRGKTLEDHERCVKEILSKLQQWGLYANLKKCVFHARQVEFLGYVVNSKGVSADPERIKDIMEWPLPKTIHELQVFLGFANFYRCFIKNYAKITASLTDLTKGNAKGHIDVSSGPQYMSFLQLKFKFSRTPILCHFDPELPIRIETDASQFVIGAVLS